MRWARKSGATGPQNSEIRKSQTLTLCASYFRVPHTQHWDGWGGAGKHPLGLLQVPLSCSAPSPAGPNIPITYTPRPLNFAFLGWCRQPNVRSRKSLSPQCPTPRPLNSPKLKIHGAESR